MLDFAFDIHSGLGMTCVGGKVNHRNVSLREVLHNGDIVEILTSKQQKPKADWLNIVTTAKARSRIKAYMREQQAQAASLGREELERKIKNWKLSVTMDDAVMVLCKYYKLKTGTGTVRPDRATEDRAGRHQGSADALSVPTVSTKDRSARCRLRR